MNVESLFDGFARARGQSGDARGDVASAGRGSVRGRAEHGDSVDVMRTIKRAMDPQNLMNPGKVLNL